MSHPSVTALPINSLHARPKDAPMLKRSDHARVARALDATLAHTRAAGNILQLDVQADQLVIFSDQHKGSCDGADDFQVAEHTYSQAIAYYNRMAYTLLALGDVEELWEEQPQPVILAYPDIFALEAQFHSEGRYLRVWGNHDDNWRYPDQVRKHLAPVYGGEPLSVKEGLLMTLTYGDEQLGSAFFLHGHQGTLDSDSFSGVSRILVRHLWRPFQRLTRIPSNTPATDWRLRHSHNIALYNWSAKQDKMLLVAGHTHRPVFESVVDQKQLQAEIMDARSRLESAATGHTHQQGLNQLEEELAWIKQAQQEKFALEQSEPSPKPSYYNSGCCCYPDGSITGIEIVAGEIRLVRWAAGAGGAQRSVLARSLLKDIFDAI